MTMRSAEKWENEYFNDLAGRPFRATIRAIQRDALKAACDAVWDMPEGVTFTYPNVKCEILALLPEEPKP